MKILKKIILILLLVGFPTIGIAHPVDNVNRAVGLIRLGELDKAETLLQRARFKMPDSPEINFNLGEVQYHKRNFVSAARFFAFAAKNTSNPDLKRESLYNLGNSAYRAGDYASAVQAYKNSIEIKEDAKAKFNLEEAEKKLKEQLEKQQKQQQNNQQQQNKDSKKNQSGDQKQDQKQGQQNNSDGKDKKNQENKDGQQGQDQNKDQKQNGQQGDEKNSEKKDGQQQQQANKDDKNKESKDGQQSEEGKEKKEKREDVKMAQQEGKEKEKPKPSQRARAIKNKKLNPYMIQKLLKQMEEREKEAQLHYRQDPQRRQDEMDPFNMNAQQLRDFFRGRRQQQKKQSDQPDW